MGTRKPDHATIGHSAVARITPACMALALLLSGCSAGDATQIVVGLATNLQVPKELDQVDLRVDRDGQQIATRQLNLDPGKPDQVELPGTVAITADDRPSIPILITVEGRRSGKVVVKRQARLAFIEDKILLLKLDLLRSCTNLPKACPKEQTCTATGCTSVDVDPKTLPTYDRDKAFASPEAGVSPDLSRDAAADHGADAGPDQAASDQTAPDQAAPDQAAPDLPSPDQAASDLLSPDLPLPDQAAPDLPLPDVAVPDQTADASPTVACTGAPILSFSGAEAKVSGQVSVSQTTSWVSLLAKNGCTGDVTPGAEAFHKITLTGGETYRVTLSADPNYNAAVYVFTACGNVAGTCVAGADKQLSGAAETLEFTPKATGQYIIGVDSRWAPGTKWSYGGYTLTVAKTGVLEPSGFRISAFTAKEWTPTVSFDGTNHLVAWSTNTIDIYAARVSKAGKVVDTTPRKVSSSSLNFCGLPSMAYGLGRYLLAWSSVTSTTTTTNHIMGARFSPAGQVMDPSNRLFTGATGTPANFLPTSVTFGANTFFVVHQSSISSKWEVRGQLISPSGSPKSAAINLSSAKSNKELPYAASDGSSFLAVWSDDRGGVYEIWGARVGPTGAVLDKSGIAIAKSVTSGTQREPAVAYNGSNYLVVWEDSRSGNWDIYGVRVSTSGAVLGTPQPLSTAGKYQQRPRLAGDNKGWLVAWQDTRNSNMPDIYGAWVGTDGKRQGAGDFPIAKQSAYQSFPGVSSNGDSHLVVWMDSRGGDYQVYGARVRR